jgi:triosephosphate isomerase
MRYSKMKQKKLGVFMNGTTRLIVANWKTYLSHTESIAWVEEHKQALIKALNTHTQLVICPSFTTLTSISAMLASTTIKLGAQDCSAFTANGHTGDITAQSLTEVGCSYCIIGHSERRKAYNESIDLIVKKADQLFTHNIIPIICVGEDRQAPSFKHIAESLTEQLMPIMGLYEAHPASHLCIAYEPAWSIGTGVIAQPTMIAAVSELIRKLAPHHVTILYGGSVNERDIKQLEQIKELDGFLIGKASTDITSLISILNA